jgi:hypothetical protein
MTSRNIRRNLYVFTLDSTVDVTKYELLLVKKFNLIRHRNSLWLVANKNNCVHVVILFSTYQSKAERLIF